MTPYAFTGVRDLRVLGSLGSHSCPVHIIRFSTDGHYLATADDDGLLVVRSCTESLVLSWLLNGDTYDDRSGTLVQGEEMVDGRALECIRRLVRFAGWHGTQPYRGRSSWALQMEMFISCASKSGRQLRGEKVVFEDDHASDLTNI